MLGYLPISMNLLKSLHNSGVIICADHLMRTEEMLSCPGLFLADKSFFMILVISCSEMRFQEVIKDSFLGFMES